MKKIKDWLFKSKVDLSKKWGHRLIKVLFIIAVICSSFFAIATLEENYLDIVNRWDYAESLDSRLRSETYTGKLVLIDDILKENEIIRTLDEMSDVYGRESNQVSRVSGSFFANISNLNKEAFCSDKLGKHIEVISRKNSINLFLLINPEYKYTYSKPLITTDDISLFQTHLQNTYGTNCVAVDKLFEKINSTQIETPILTPVNTNNYIIFEHKKSVLDFMGFTLYLVSMLLFATLVIIVIYYKVILYIIYGNQ